MNSNAVGDYSMALIHQAEDECAAHDPGMISAAAMVLVGDVYALFVCKPGAPLRRPVVSDPHERETGLSPFIR